MPSSRRSGILIALILFVAIAVAIRIFGGPLYDMLISLHGRGGH